MSALRGSGSRQNLEQPHWKGDAERRMDDERIRKEQAMEANELRM